MHFIFQLKADLRCSALLHVTITSLINLASLNQQLLNCPSRDGKTTGTELPAQGEQASEHRREQDIRIRKHLSDNTWPKQQLVWKERQRHLERPGSRKVF